LPAAPDLVAVIVDLPVHVGVVPSTEVYPARPPSFLTVSLPVIRAGACVEDVRTGTVIEPVRKDHSESS
jgi:hypothetical protein